MSVAPNLRASKEEIDAVLKKLKDQGMEVQGADFDEMSRLLQKLSESLPSWQRSLRQGATTGLEEALYDLCKAVFEAWAGKSVADIKDSDKARSILSKMATALSTLSMAKVVGCQSVPNRNSNSLLLTQLAPGVSRVN